MRRSTRTQGREPLPSEKKELRGKVVYLLLVSLHRALNLGCVVTYCEADAEAERGICNQRGESLDCWNTNIVDVYPFRVHIKSELTSEGCQLGRPTRCCSLRHAARRRATVFTSCCTPVVSTTLYRTVLVGIATDACNTVIHGGQPLLLSSLHLTMSASPPLPPPDAVHVSGRQHSPLLLRWSTVDCKRKTRR